MKGWRIFLKSVRLVFRNLGVALRLSLLPYLLVMVVTWLSLPPDGGEDGRSALALLVFWGLMTSWIAVAWHRYVLAGEHPKSWFPAWHGKGVLLHLERSLLILLLILLLFLMVAVVAALAPFGGLAMMEATPDWLVAGLIELAMVCVVLRFAVMSPAAALGWRMSLREAWVATRSFRDAGLLPLIVLLGLMLVDLPARVIDHEVLFTLYNGVVGWFTLMLCLSLLTTLYGHYVEGRRLD